MNTVDKLTDIFGSQTALACALGVSQPHVSRMRRDGIPIAMLRRLAATPDATQHRLTLARLLSWRVAEELARDGFEVEVDIRALTRVPVPMTRHPAAPEREADPPP